MRILTAIVLALFIHAASAETGLPQPCHADFGVHASVEGRTASEILVNASDIRAVSRNATDSSRLMIALEAPAAQRMKDFTSRNIGEELVIMCSGESIWRASINDTFGDRFEIRLPEQAGR